MLTKDLEVINKKSKSFFGLFIQLNHSVSCARAAILVKCTKVGACVASGLGVPSKLTCHSFLPISIHHLKTNFLALIAF